MYIASDLSISYDLNFCPMRTRRILICASVRRYDLLVSFVFFFICFFPLDLVAQDIVIKNPSLEFAPKGGSVPDGWLITSLSPDIQPGNYQVTLPASDGKTYVGLLSTKDWVEGFCQKLNGELIANQSYLISFDLAYSSLYYTNVCHGYLEIFAGNSPSDKGEKLWSSGVFDHQEWKTYSAILRPSKNYSYISFWSYFDSTCTSAKLSGVLIDNLSAEIRQVPEVSVSATSSCAGIPTGTADVSVKGGQGPYNYLWLPGEYTSSRVTNLASGEYEVVVTAANGVNVKKKVSIEDYRIDVAASISYADCYSNQSHILLNVTGGFVPYAFSIDNENTYQSASVFSGIENGKYNIVVRDSYGCKVEIDDIIVSKPPLLQATAQVKNVSCSGVRDGRISLMAEGGEPPYTYVVSGHSQNDGQFINLSPGVYNYTVWDNNNCSVEGEGEILNELRDCAVFIPTAFSPNGDGKNDIFRARVHDAVTDFRLAVYGRWGQLVYETRDPERGWDGSQMPAGSYLWIVTYTDSKQQLIQQKGDVVLIR